MNVILHVLKEAYEFKDLPLRELIKWFYDRLLAGIFKAIIISSTVFGIVLLISALVLTVKQCVHTSFLILYYPNNGYRVNGELLINRVSKP